MSYFFTLLRLYRYNCGLALAIQVGPDPASEKFFIIRQNLDKGSMLLRAAFQAAKQILAMLSSLAKPHLFQGSLKSIHARLWTNAFVSPEPSQTLF
jgi:hypothetical protein